MASKIEERVSKHDREIAAIRKLILTGMRMIVKNDQRHEQHFLRMEGAQFELRQEQIALRAELRALSSEVRALTVDMRALSAGQRRLEKTVDTFVRSLGRGRNGHS